jgi:hypothetical protein
VLYGLGSCEFLMIWRWWCGCAVRIGFLRVLDSAPPRVEFSFSYEFWVKNLSLIWCSSTCVLSSSCSNDLILIQTFKMIFFGLIVASVRAQSSTV